MNVGRALKITCVGIAGGIILRVINMLYSFDYNTGFYTDDGMFAWLIVAFIVAVSVLCVIMVMRDKASLRGMEEKRSAPVGVVALLSAFALIGIGVLQGKEHLDFISLGYVGRQYPMSSDIHLLLCIAMVIFGILQVCAAIALFRGKNFFLHARLLYLLSTLWAAIYLLFVFVYFTNSSSTPENIYTLLGAGGLLLSLFYLAKLLSGVGKERTAKIFCVIAIPTVIINTTYSVSNIVLSFLGNTYFQFGELPIILQYVVAAVSLFILVELFTLRKFSAAKPGGEDKRLKDTASVKKFRDV